MAPGNAVPGSAVPGNAAPRVALWVLAAALLCGCAEQHRNPVVEGQDIRITFLHTADLHSRLLPFDAPLAAADEAVGLRAENAPFGGIARIAHVLRMERERGDRVVYVDSGGILRGAPIFEVFRGEPEVLALSQLRPLAVTIGNHELDDGTLPLAELLLKASSYPLLAANYLFVPGSPLGEIVRPYHIANVGGVRLGIIGIANTSALPEVTDVGSPLGVLPMNGPAEIQMWIDVLRPQVDMVVGVSHAGLEADAALIAATSGLDLVFGGHSHVVLSPPRVVADKAGRQVPLVHSGSGGKTVGRLDVVVRDGEVRSHKYTAIPIDARIPEDPVMLSLLQPYVLELWRTFDLTSVFGYASRLLRRTAESGGDSPLGNLVAEAIRFQARADFAVTNTHGVQADLGPGPVTYDTLFGLLPYGRTIATMIISGADIRAMLDHVARKSAGRGCSTRVQVAGLDFVLNCEPPSDACPDCPRAEEVTLTDCSSPVPMGECQKTPILPDNMYEMATNDYLAEGGSGFTVLATNTTQVDTGVPLRDALLESVERSDLCVSQCLTSDGRVALAECSAFEGCVESLTAFHDRWCEKLELTVPEKQLPMYCGHDDQRCTTSDECLGAEELCSGGDDCQWCLHASECDPEGCEGYACRCYENRCVADRMKCIRGRCLLKCEVDADCPRYLTTAGLLHLCIDGGCVPHPAIGCVDDAACNPALLYCFGDGADCLHDGDCGEGQACEDRRCIPRRTRCTKSEECPAGRSCWFGWCAPDAPCSGPAECSGSCVSGNCQRVCSTCTEDSHCPGNASCVRGLCVPLLSRCVENRCRSACLGMSAGIAECPAANTCIDKLCRPNACLVPPDSKTRCHIDNESLDTRRCLEMPCVHAESDGRIRTKPAAKGSFPPDLSPDDVD